MDGEKTMNPFLAVHGGAEQLAKYTLWRSLKPKLGARGAALEVERHLFDYSDRPALLALADKYGLWVFNAFPTKAFGLFVDTLIHQPDLIARYPRLQKMLFEEVPSAKGAYRGLKPEQQGPFVSPEAGGPPKYLDVGRHQTFSQALDLTQKGVQAAQKGRKPAAELMLNKRATSV
jgi:hypothetical protein